MCGWTRPWLCKPAAALPCKRARPATTTAWTMCVKVAAPSIKAPPPCVTAQKPPPPWPPGTLTSSDIANRSDYKASGTNLSGGFTVAGNKPANQSTGTSSTVDNGENWSWQNFDKTGTSGAAAGVSSDRGSAQSATATNRVKLSIKEPFSLIYK